jgi:Tol biopolymer transport system component
VNGSWTDVYFPFVYDRRLGTTTRLAVDDQGTEPNGSTVAPAISGDGTTVVFLSAASNWVADDTNGQKDVFAYGVQSRTVDRLSGATTDRHPDWVLRPLVGADGRYLTFWSTEGLQLFDRADGSTTLLERDSADYAISSDMTYFAFTSNSPALVPRDMNQVADVFVRATFLPAGT